MMLRTARKISPLIRSLVFGTAAITTVSVASTVLIGCEDENKPEYHIKRLDDPIVRPAAVKRLALFFEDAMTRADKNREHADVKALLDTMVPPLTKLYLDTSIEDRTRREVLKLLADTRDVRAKEAWVKALKDYQPNAHEPEIKAAIQAINDTGIRDKDATDAIIGAFLKLEAGSEKGSQIWLDYKNAMTEISSPEWKPQLIERLNRPMEMVTANDKDNEEKIRKYRNEQFWQVTAADILGNIRASDAVKPLFKTIIDPNKADAAATAVMSLVKIGAPSMTVLQDALLGKDAEIIEFAKTVVKNKNEVDVTPVRTAALVIGTMGRGDGVASLMLALDKVEKRDFVTRAILVRELSKLPSTPESVKAALAVLRDTPVSVVIPPGMSAVPMLTESLMQFYDASLVDVLIKLVNDTKGDEEDKLVVRDAALAIIIKLMKKDQIELVENSINGWAKKPDDAKLEKEAFKKAKELLTSCDQKIDCYLAKIEEPAVQEKEQQFIGIKAANMLGILGNDSTRAELVKRLPRIKNAAIKFAVGQAIDHLAPTGDKAAADEIDKMITENVKKGDRNLIAGDAALRQIMWRLRARL